jgi:PAS domain S-box-containing protein
MIERQRPAFIRDALWFAVFVAAYYIAYHFGMSFSRTTASPFWFPDSVLLCALLKSRPRAWWILILATVPLRLFSDVARDVPMWFLLGATAIDSAKGLIGAVAMRRMQADPFRFGTMRELLLFMLVVALAIPALSAFGGAALRHGLGYDFWPSWTQWFLGDALAQLVVTPAILYGPLSPHWQNQRLDRWRVVEATGLTVGLVVSTYLASYTSAEYTAFVESRFFAPVPFLLWAAIRFGAGGAAGAMALVSGITVAAAIGGRGPFAGTSPADTAFALRNFLLLRAALLLPVAVSIDQRNRAERSLRESEERFRRMAQSAPILLWMSDGEKQCIFVNKFWLDFTGRTLEQELGNGWVDGVHPDDLKGWSADCYAAFDAREPFELEYRLRRRDGSYRWVIDKGVPRYAPDGEFAGYIGTAVDISERKQAELANREMAHTQRLAIMGELTAAIAHELRQPMSAILLDAQTAERQVNSDRPSLNDLREIAASIRENITRIDAVISRIRGFLRRQETHVQIVDANVLVQGVVKLVSTDAISRRIHLLTEFDMGLEPVFGDRTQLEQVLLNLLVNAMEAMDDVTSHDSRLTIRTLAADEGGVEIIVSDTGRGIAPEQLPLLFESFFTSRKDGMGLGLSIAKSIVEAHRGRIWAENNCDRGAAFHVVLPWAGRHEMVAARTPAH